MSTLAHPQTPTAHEGASSAPSQDNLLHSQPEPARSLAAMLLAAIVSALVVVADSVAGSYADGHLLIGWILLWAVGFAALALFADIASTTAARASQVFAVCRRRLQQQRADTYLIALAQHDPRIMAEVEAAVERAVIVKRSIDQAIGRAWLDRLPLGTLNAAYAGPRRGFRAISLAGVPTQSLCLPI